MRCQAPLLLLVLLAGCGGSERRSGGPSSGGPEHASSTGRTRPAGGEPAGSQADDEEDEDEDVPEAPAGTVTSFDLELAAAKLAGDVRAKRAALGQEPVVGDGMFRNDSVSSRLDMGLVEALLMKALLDERLAVKVWDDLEVPDPAYDDTAAAERERKATVLLDALISRERVVTEAGAKVVMTYRMLLRGTSGGPPLVTTTMTTTQTREDEPRAAGPPGPVAEVDLSRAIAACARTVAAAKPARVEVLEVEDRTRRQLDDIGPALVGRLGAAGVAAEAVQPASERLTPEEVYAERGDEEGGGGEEAAPPRKPRATHALATQLFEESWTSDDGERYRSVIAVFVLIDAATNEVTAMSVTRVRG